MIALAILFWACAACVAYAYLGYPLLLWCATRLWSRPVRKAPFAGRVSIVVAAYNEEQRIAARREELLSLLDMAAIPGELIIVSDGSCDQTAAAARNTSDRRIRVIELVQNEGKAKSISLACAIASGDVIIFADARQCWAADAMPRLLENFADPAIGGVSGDLILEAAGGAIGVGFYWRYEKAVRRLEGQLHSTVGVTGAICAVRRSLFAPIPARTILDDLYWPMRVAMRGFRVVHDERARAFDCLPGKARDEFRRKVRTLSGNYQLIARLPAVLLPWQNPLWLQFVSHKALRLAVPWLLIGMLVASALLHGIGYRIAFALQMAGYLLALAGMHGGFASRVRVASVAASFLLLNAAAWSAFWVWVCGRAGSSWQKVVYVGSGCGPLGTAAHGGTEASASPSV